MVHTGPARGCVKCKERHVKCDMERPKCRQCAKVKIECPGYRHQVDILLRDQTIATVRRYEKKKTAPLRKVLKVANEDQPTLPKQIAPSLEDYAVTFLFSDIVDRPARVWGASHGHFDFLLKLHNDTSRDSALSAVITWMGVVVLGVRIWGEPSPEEDILLSKAINRVSTTLNDPIACLSDETLAAVMMLQHGENFRDLRYRHRMPSRVHQHGAEALIRKRGLLNFKDIVSRTLYAAVRYNAVDFALCTGEQGLSWSLWDYGKLCLEEDKAISSKPAMQLDGHAVSLLAIRSKIEAGDWINDDFKLIALRARLQNVLNVLYSWEKNLPNDWKPHMYSRFAHHYTTKDVAYVFGQRYLLELGARLCLLKLNTFAYGSDNEHRHIEGLDTVLEVIDKIIASESSLMGIEDIAWIGTSDVTSPRMYCNTDSMTCTEMEGFPCITVNQCLASGIGARFLSQTLDALHSILSRFCKQLSLPDFVVMALRDRILWAERERHTILLAYPMRDV